MSQPELLKQVIGVLEDTGVDYMVTGSFASSLHGEPRMSHDIDLVVAIPESAVDKLMEAFPFPDYYLDRGAVLRAVRSKDMFNLLEVASGDKVDFWILGDEPFDRSRFARRYEDEAVGVRFLVSTPEDTILVKLKWAKECGGSEKQFTDAPRVFEIQYDRLDMSYLRQWADRLGVRAELDRLVEAAQIAE